MSIKTVSIVIPALNEEDRLALCLDSIASLNYPKDSVEAILIDNGSTDKTIKIASAYGIEILSNHSKNVSGLRNIGGMHCRGEILAFLDADCVVSPDWLTSASKYFDEFRVAAWGCPPCPPENPTWVQQTWYLVRQKRQLVQEVDWLESMNLFVRKRDFIEIGCFNESLVTCEDVDLCYKLRSRGKIICDCSIKVTHLGEAASLREFVRKEAWRGKSNLAGIRSHGLSAKELPSLSIPAYFGILLPTILIYGLFSTDWKWLLAFTLLSVLPSGSVLFKLRLKTLNLLIVIRLFVLLQLYFFSRSLAILKRN